MHKLAERKKISIEVPGLGKVLELRKPTVGEQEAYEDALNELRDKPGSVAKLMAQFLEGCGASAEDARALEHSEYQEIMEIIMGSKKN